MGTLVVISITAAYGHSVVAFSLEHAGYELETREFFETSCLFITLVLFGRLTASIAKVIAFFLSRESFASRVFRRHYRD